MSEYPIRRWPRQAWLLVVLTAGACLDQPTVAPDGPGLETLPDIPAYHDVPVRIGGPELPWPDAPSLDRPLINDGHNNINDDGHNQDTPQIDGPQDSGDDRPQDGQADRQPDAPADLRPPRTDRAHHIPPDVAPPRCPADMVDQGALCMDPYEAPNVPGALPLVMYTFDEAAAWCAHRGKRLCYDDEWTDACEGPEAWAYPYGDAHQPGRCNDDELWRTYDQTKLNAWPWTVSTPDRTSLEDLLDATRAAGAAVAADHVWDLYQGEGSGTNAGCLSAWAVQDLQGNVEEWTRRRDGGDGPDFLGNLKGRYWAEARTCQSGVKSHGNGFRFYEIGFRCCRDLP